MVIDTSIFIEFLRTKNKDLTTLKKIPKNTIISISNIFIAATSIIHKTPLLTLNKKHFINIPDIELFEIQN